MHKAFQYILEKRKMVFGLWPAALPTLFKVLGVGGDLFKKNPLTVNLDRLKEDLPGIPSVPALDLKEITEHEWLQKVIGKFISEAGGLQTINCLITVQQIPDFIFQAMPNKGLTREAFSLLMETLGFDRSETPELFDKLRLELADPDGTIRREVVSAKKGLAELYRRVSAIDEGFLQLDMTKSSVFIKTLSLYPWRDGLASCLKMAGIGIDDSDMEKLWKRMKDAQAVAQAKQRQLAEQTGNFLGGEINMTREIGLFLQENKKLPKQLVEIVLTLACDVDDEHISQMWASAGVEDCGLIPLQKLPQLLFSFRKDGVDFAAFKEILQRIGVPVNERLMRQVFTRMDIDGSGRLGVHEFKAGFLNVFTTVLPVALVESIGLSEGEVVAGGIGLAVLLVLVFAFILLSFAAFGSLSAGWGSTLAQLVLVGGASGGAASGGAPKSLQKYIDGVAESLSECLQIPKSAILKGMEGIMEGSGNAGAGGGKAQAGEGGKNTEGRAEVNEDEEEV
uniref:EF-hand domain-containing protein n=1 Tax=Chromera velia CCMP2878 TaxID=1169474 RepID=A0A0G4F5J5_9ALVE|eukprot:Cvel_2787.t1-p1 / transcript=Cvel_2787.t1 / gene=Cvel_2787 / organism=Chromera_velia_CCMP2878 / gene_product=hypothetical protein / transcript_product=hypothetical protein / location=Cvel_scaffold112:81814-85212(-) / protein_length=506 / sequence_SO=supercontig / SO=protein_coding / is_pseudo=false